MTNRESASVRILLVSREIPTIEMLCETIQKMAIHVEPCCEISTAGRKLCRSKFEGIIVDFNDKPQALDLLRSMRCSTAHKAAVAFALLNREYERSEAFAAGANFYLERPLVVRTVLNTLRAALPIMVRERRRYYRCPMEADVQVVRESGVSLAAKSMNISEGGMAFSTTTTFRDGEKLRLSFTLPETHEKMTISGEVCWNNENGQVGVQLVNLPMAAKEQLQMWLAQKLEVLTPMLSAGPAVADFVSR